MAFCSSTFQECGTCQKMTTEPMGPGFTMGNIPAAMGKPTGWVITWNSTEAPRTPARSMSAATGRRRRPIGLLTTLTGSKYQRPLQTNAGRTTMANHAPPSEVRFNFERKEFGKTTLTQWNRKRTNVFDFEAKSNGRKRLPDDILRQKSNIKNPLGVKVEFLEMFRNIPRGRSHGQCMGSRANSTTKMIREHSHRHHTDHTLGHDSGHVSRVVNHFFRDDQPTSRGLGQPESSPRVFPPGCQAAPSLLQVLQTEGQTTRPEPLDLPPRSSPRW